MVKFEDLMNVVQYSAEIPVIRPIDKLGRFYHVVQRASNRDNIYDSDLAKYRENLLCRICAMYNVVVLFSVVLSNHTHDILLANNWEDIATIIRLVNTAVSHRVRKKNPKKYSNGRRVFESTPYYRAIHDIVDLYVVSKYVFDNVKNVVMNKGFVPYSCFWYMENGNLTKPYNRKIYQILFGMSIEELCSVFNENDISTVKQMALTRYQDWSQADNDRLFKTNVSKPWLNQEFFAAL